MKNKDLYRDSFAGGKYYPGDKKELEKLINESLKTYKDFKIESPFGLIMPCIDYKRGFELYGLGYSQLLNEEIDTVIFISTVHKTAFPGIALTKCDYFKTLMGDVCIDKEANSFLNKYNSEDIIYNDDYHNSENSIEIQLPYIHSIFNGKAKIIPILLGEANTKYTLILSNAISDLMKKKNKKFFIIATTNLSQNVKYEESIKSDNKFIDLLNSMNADRLAENIAMREVNTDSGGSVVALFRIAERFGFKNAKILKYLNSFEDDNDKYKTSGYISALIW